MRYKSTDKGNIPFTDAENAEWDAIVAEAESKRQIDAEISAKKAMKQTGVKIKGVMCSATKNDQSGLSAVALGVTIARANNKKFPDTRFEFDNGNSLIITDDNFDEIYEVWTPFRQSFFAVEP